MNMCNYNKLKRFYWETMLRCIKIIVNTKILCFLKCILVSIYLNLKTNANLA